MKKKKVIISLGGTGGHIYPAVALYTELIHDTQVSFIGGSLSTNRFFADTNLPYTSVSCHSLATKNPFKLMKGVFRLLLGVKESISAYRREKPDLVVGFGSYYSFPPLIAALLMRIPIILHEANSVPGRVNRLLSPLAKLTAIHFPETQIGGKPVLVQMPIRFKAEGNKKIALQELNLNEGKHTILIFGGSQGASKLNHLFLSLVPALDPNKFQVIHLTGCDDATKTAQEAYRQAGLTSFVKTFDKRMNLFLQAADLALTRSGASTVAELIAFHVPSILVPYPFATDAHQDKNASYISDTLQGGITKSEASLTPEILSQLIRDLFETKKHLEMKENLKKAKLPTLTLSNLIKEL